MAKKQPIVKKRALISKSQGQMFAAVVLATILLGACGSSSFFLVKQISFYAEVVGERGSSIKQLKDNKTAVEEVTNQVSALSTNPQLTALKLDNSSDGLTTILDALPAVGNASAFGSSLLELIKGTDVQVESVSVEPTADDKADQEGADTATTSTPGDDSSNAALEVKFNLKVTGTNQQLHSLLRKLERSIRPIYLDTVSLEYASEGNSSLSIEGHTFYQSEVVLELKSRKKEYSVTESKKGTESGKGK